MLKKIPILPVILLLALTACQGGTKGSGEATPAQATTPPTQVAKPTTAPTLAAIGTPGESTSLSTPDTAVDVPAKCTVVSQAAQPTQDSPFAPVSESDWKQGADNARVTITEYSDFQ